MAQRGAHEQVQEINHPMHPDFKRYTWGLSLGLNWLDAT